MENGVGVVDGYEKGEKSVEVGVIEGRVEEEGRVVVGSDEVKDLDGGEVFEEAMSDTEDLEEHGSLDGGVGGGDRDVEVVGESGLRGVDENLNGGYEVEKFEEASEVASLDVVGSIEDKVESLVDGKSVDGVVVEDGVDEGGTEKEVENDEFNGLREDVVVDSGENGGKEVSEIVAGGEEEVLKGEDEVDVKSGLVIERPEDKDSDDVNLEQMTVDEKAESGGCDKLEGSVIESPVEPESKLSLSLSLYKLMADQSTNPSIMESKPRHPLHQIAETPTHKLLLKQWLKEEELILGRITLKETQIDSVRKEITMLYIFFFLFHSISLVLLFNASSSNDPLGHNKLACHRSWIPSLCSILFSLGIIWAVRYKTDVEVHLEKLLEREKEDGKLLAKCAEELKKKGLEFDLLKEVDALRRAKSLRVEAKEVRKWSARDFVTLFFFTMSCFVLAITRVILCN